LDSVRDWGYAPEYMEAAWQMLQQDTPRDWVIATGEPHTVKDWVEAAWRASKMSRPAWDFVQSVPQEKRPTDIEWLVGNPRSAHETLRWEAKTRFAELAARMMKYDLDRIKQNVQEASA
jgi:GDPmannose 4,6-dehydratase